MALTKEEMLLVAQFAEEYPPGWGSSMFANRRVFFSDEAEILLESGECRVDDG